MAANIFSISGDEVNSLAEFMRKEKKSQWNNILYYPDLFGKDDGKYLVFDNKSFANVSFKDTNFKNIRFIRCVFNKCLFMGAVFNDCEFTDCQFIDTNTSKLKINRTLIDPKCFDNNFDLKNDTNIAVNLYHALYKNSSREYQSDHALDSLYKMKVAEFHHLRSRFERGVITKKEYNKQRTKHAIYNFISGYGLKTSKVVRLLLIFIATFSFFNFILSGSIFEQGPDFSFIDSIYFTCVTVTTLGYGDITPYTSFGKIFVAMQALFGFVVISLFMAAVINKALKAV
ncbi:ion channel [Pectobacterium polaris]|uniref:ion channel n=1 Tax=Pectobacterium polaris TaxID=2042057 RepID=UPI000EA1CD64|nr:ion channel [Pectobacterium polaris]RJL18598.1 hypothetical protein D5074_20770 [Pectobacterium polaris]